MSNARNLYRVYKAAFYIISFCIDVSSVLYRQKLKSVHVLDKHDVMLLMQSWLSTSCFLVNIGCNQIYDIVPANSWLQTVALFVSNCTFISGYHLPCLYVFIKNKQLRHLLFKLYFIDRVCQKEFTTIQISNASQTFYMPSNTVILPPIER
uniref:7TM_GPCR_Srx domain-containing protein n=1 Tax=Panagrellus redivivus TaxID=6233 RepID=A0A7E4W2Z0_PANRE